MNSLNNLHVLVTRPSPQGEALCHAITALGGEAIHFPTIDFTPYLSPAELEHNLATLHQQDWLIFISPQAVYSSIADIRRFWPHLPDTVKFAAVGAGTADALTQAGYGVTVYPEFDWNSEGLLALPVFQTVAGKKITVIRGRGGREKIDTILAERGAQVSALMVYQRVLPTVLPATMQHSLTLIEQEIINRIICTSCEGVNNVKIMLGEIAWPYLAKIPLIVVSERIKILAENLGFQTIWVTRNASQAAILERLADKRTE